MGRDPKEQALVLMWHDIVTLEGYLGAQELLRNSSDFFKGRALPGPVPYEQIPALVERGKKRIGVFARKLDERLAQSEFVAGDRYSYADIAAYVTIGFAKRASGEDPADGHTSLSRWLEAIAARPAVQAATG